jgi:hypothetical protein
MGYMQRLMTLGLAVVVAVGMAASGCASPWFSTGKKSLPAATSPAQATADPSTDQKQAAIAYINGLCNLPPQQRDSLVRGLNEALLPNHAAISCGRSGGS